MATTWGTRTPVYVDWDGDELPDLMRPNLTNPDLLVPEHRHPEPSQVRTQAPGLE